MVRNDTDDLESQRVEVIELQTALAAAQQRIAKLKQERDALLARVPPVVERPDERLAARCAALESELAASVQQQAGWQQQATEVRLQETTLRERLSEAQQQRANLQEQLDDAGQQHASLQAQLADGLQQRADLQEQVADLARQRDALASVIDQSRRREAREAEEGRTVQAERNHLQQQLAQADQRVQEITEALATRDADLQVLTEQRDVAELTCTHALRGLELSEQEKRQLTERLEELEALQRAADDRSSEDDAEILLRGDGFEDLREACDEAVEELSRMGQDGAEDRTPGTEAAAVAGAAGRTTPAGARPAAGGGLHLAGGGGPGPRRSAPTDGSAPSGGHTAGASVIPLGFVGAQRLTVLHVESADVYRQVVQSVMPPTADIHYVNSDAVPALPPDSPSFLVLNLLAGDALVPSSVASLELWQRSESAAFAYCAVETSGFVLGLVDLFPYPFDMNACAAGLISRPDGTRRVLVVSEETETVSELRNTLLKMRCSTSMAFDSRQAADLLHSVRPEILLIDMTLPRGDAFRTLLRVRSDPKAKGIALALMWAKPYDRDQIREHGLRAVRDVPLACPDLATKLTAALATTLATYGSRITGNEIRAQAG